jgi:dCTP diphosphatase
MTDQTTTITDLKKRIDEFIAERDWKQFHNAKNLSMAISAEVAELMEHFLWIDPKKIDAVMAENRHEIEHEIADIAWMLLCFCNRYDIDLTTVIASKTKINEQRYSVLKSKGRSDKYTKL